MNRKMTDTEIGLISLIFSLLTILSVMVIWLYAIILIGYIAIGILSFVITFCLVSLLDICRSE